MAVFENSTELLADAQRVFQFLVNVRNMSQVMPASPRFEIVDAPPRLQMGTRFTAIIYKYGLSRKIVSEVTWFEEGVGFTDIMLQGPFPVFNHTHRVVATATGCRMSDRIEFAPPRGLLGWYWTESKIRRELTETFAFRDRRFREVLS